MITSNRTIISFIRKISLFFVVIYSGFLFTQAQESTIPLKVFTMDYRSDKPSLVDVSFLLDPPAGKDGFIRVEGGHLVKSNGERIRFWGFNLTEWSRGSTSIPPKEDAPKYAEALARFGVNCVRLHFLDLNTPRGLIDGTLNNSQHFDQEQLDREDFFIAELKKRGIYVNFNLNVGRSYKEGDGVQDYDKIRWGKGLTFFDPRIIELQKDYAKQLLTHYNPYTKMEYRNDPAVAIVEILNENDLSVGFNSTPYYNNLLTELYNDWLKKNISVEKLKALREITGVSGDELIPRLARNELRDAPKERFNIEMDFYTGTEAAFFNDMNSYLKDTLGIKCPIVASADHGHSNSSYPLLMSMSQLDIVDGHTYWEHGGDRRHQNTPMVNSPFDGSILELSRTAVANKPYTVSETNHPFPNQWASEGIPILASYAGFQDWDGIFFYTFERKLLEKDMFYMPDAFDMSHDPVKMPQFAAGALIFLRGDMAPAKQTIERTYTKDQVYQSKLLPNTERPYFTFDGSGIIWSGSQNPAGGTVDIYYLLTVTSYHVVTGTPTSISQPLLVNFPAIDSPIGWPAPSRAFTETDLA